MALHNLRITVVDGGSKARATTEAKSGTPKKSIKDTTTWKLTHPRELVQDKIKKNMQISPRTSYAIGVGAGLAKQVISSAFNYYISDIGRRTGDSNYQAMVNRQIEVAKDFALNPLASTLGGAAAGAMFGPVGAIIGATAGLASSLISTGFKYAERERAYVHQMFKENNNQAYNLSRTNYTAMTGRVR